MSTVAELAALPYRAPSWDAPIDVDEAIARCPSDARIKGLMSAAVVEMVGRAGHRLVGAADRFLPFQSYPLRDHMALLREAGHLLWPADPVRVQLRRFGRGVRPTLLSQPYGRVALGKDNMTPAEIVNRLVRTYRFILDVTITPHIAEATDPTSSTSIYVEMHNVWYFLDSCHVGVFEGLLMPDEHEPARRPSVHVSLFDDHNGVFRIKV
jgi:uncharacterized protein (TIGR02265 family)